MIQLRLGIASLLERIIRKEEDNTDAILKRIKKYYPYAYWLHLPITSPLDTYHLKVSYAFWIAVCMEAAFKVAEKKKLGRTPIKIMKTDFNVGIEATYLMALWLGADYITSSDTVDIDVIQPLIYSYPDVVLTFCVCFLAMERKGCTLLDFLTEKEIKNVLTDVQVKVSSTYSKQERVELRKIIS
jgi:hypothetical protein